MNRLIRPQPIGGAPLVRDYLREVPAALKFFSGSPFKLASYRQKIDEVTRRFAAAPRERIAEILHPTSANSRDRLDRFVREGGAVVTTGQQTGIFTGPLYTVYKAISAAVLAEHLEAALGTLVLPVFWVASEDHDWAEVNHVWLLDPASRLRRFESSSEDLRPLPMSARPLEEDLETISDEVVQYVGGNGYTREAINRIVAPYRTGGGTVASAFREAIASLLTPFDVLLADAADPALKRMSLPILRTALTESEREEAALVERTGQLVADGYSAQVAVLEGGTNLFLSRGGVRERVYRRDGGFAVRGHREALGRAELLDLLEAEPDRFSPNVLLRPVVESHLFPTIAYVGGPGELAYFAQVAALMERYAIRPPVVVPRFSGLVVEPAIERTLSKLGLTIDDLSRPWEALAEQWARREVPPRTAELLSELRRQIVERFDDLAQEVERSDVALRDAVEGLRNQALHHAGRAERKVVRTIKRRSTVQLEQLARVQNAVRPHGQPQDRVLNILPFLARHGDEFVVALGAAIRESWRLPVDD